MLERAFEDNSDDKDVNMWVRKNRQGKAGDIKVEITANDTFTAFTDKNDPTPPMVSMWEGLDSNLDFDNDSDIPF
jgi:hypothetical protein